MLLNEMMIEKGLAMEKEDYMLQHWLHGLRVRCVGLLVMVAMIW